MSNHPERRESNIIENHVQTIISFIVLCTLGWVGTTVQKNTALLSDLKTDVAIMKAKDEITMANEYGKQDANEERMSRLEYENRTVERLRHSDWQRKHKEDSDKD